MTNKVRKPRDLFISRFDLVDVMIEVEGCRTPIDGIFSEIRLSLGTRADFVRVHVSGHFKIPTRQRLAAARRDGVAHIEFVAMQLGVSSHLY